LQNYPKGAVAKIMFDLISCGGIICFLIYSL
jgi:hypothetical protein